MESILIIILISYVVIILILILVIHTWYFLTWKKRGKKDRGKIINKFHVTHVAMKEQILKMVNMAERGLDTEAVAGKITSMVMEFIEWLNFESAYISVNDSYWNTEINEMTKIDKIFDYWFSNIRNKEG